MRMSTWSSCSTAFVLLVATLISSSSRAFAQSCGGAGIDISALSGRTISAVINGYPWTISPCGVVSDVPGIKCRGQACQGNTMLSAYSPANVTWTVADNGLVMQSQTGDLCAAVGNTPRQTTIRYVCNTQASSPFISDSQELPQCHYLLIVQTSAVCTPPANIRSVGSTYVSDLCGGGAYDLASGIPNDIVFTTTDSSSRVYVNPCNTVQSTNCANAPHPLSVCQSYLPESSLSTNVFQLAEYSPAQAPVQYTLLSNGIIQYYADGQYANGYPRAMNITYICSSNPTTIDPSTFRVQVASNGQVTYFMIVTTPAVCDQPAFQPLKCRGAGYILDSIAGTQISITTGGWNWIVSPCSNVHVSASGGCTGQACQGNTELGYYDPALAIWTPTDNGVMQQIQDGAGCGGIGPRQTTLRFICNTTASTPFILNVNEWPQCHYQFEIMTSAACGVDLSTSVGSTYVSDICGGGAYNLNRVSPGADIQYVAPDRSWYLFINPCGQTYNQSCSNIGASVCQAYTPLNYTNPSNDFNLATWNPAAAPIRYTLLSNGIRQTHVDGWYCDNGFVRVVSIDYVCNQQASVPTVTSFVTNNCVYNITVQTDKVCMNAYTSVFPTCRGGGFDLSKSLAGVQLRYLQNDDNQFASYVINICSNVSGSDPYVQGCGAQVCSNGYSLSYFDSTAQWIPADNGVVQITQTGQVCGGDNNRYVALRFVCDLTASTPFISSSGELPTCHYFVIVNTNAVCSKPADFQAIGKQWVSDICGGGAYNLAAISGSDIVYVQGTGSDSNSVFNFFNPCGSVTNASCGRTGTPLDESYCQSYWPLNFENPSNTYKIASYDPVRAPVMYTIIPNGLIQYYAAGDYNGGFPRAINITYVCEASATTPYINSLNTIVINHPEAPVAGSYQAVYQVEVRTKVVCGTPFQKATCGYGGVDLSSLVGITLSGTFNNAAWYVAPCSSVHASATFGCTGQVCQSGYAMSTYDPINTQWTLADDGLIQQNQDGVWCGTSFARATTIRYVCSTTTYLSMAVEDPTCHYTLTIQTPAACGSNNRALPVSRAVGSTYFSDLCGGDAYLLSAVSPTEDIQYITGGSYVFINPCGPVRNLSCAGLGAYNSLASVCQVYTLNFTNPTNDYMLASWNPQSAPIRYTLLSNGIQQTHSDGSFCGNNLRVVSINYLCDSTQIKATVTSFAVGNNCVYNITVMTAAVCHTAFGPTCKANGYDLTSISSRTISAYVNGWYWSVSPCGNVSNSLYPDCRGQVCQASTVISSWNPAIATWTNADNGVVQYLQDGDSCGGNGLREGAIRFICVPSATNAYIVSSGEDPSCHYTIEVATSAVCPVDLTYRNTPGVSWVSDSCGGGAYNLAALGFDDIVYAEMGSNSIYAYLFFNPCGYVQNKSCGQLGSTSLCEAYTPLNLEHPSNDFQIAVYDPARSPVTYTIIPNGLVQYYQTGAYSGGNPRALNVTWTCSYSATTPIITSYHYTDVFQPGSTSQYTSIYQLAVQTNVVCSVPFSNAIPACGTTINNQNYNLTSLYNQVMTLEEQGFTWFVNPCGQVNAEAAYGCTGQVCQDGYLLSQYTPSGTTWVPADNGVLAISKGSYCAAIQNQRQTTLRFICDKSASTPRLISGGEKPTCKYDLEITTNLVCGLTPSHNVGSTFVSDLCGGGIYDLTPLSTTDIVSFVDGTAYIFINPCGVVKNASCAGLDASVCYAYTPLRIPPSQDYLIAAYDPVHAAISYTVLSNGLIATHTDGAYCGMNLDIPRTVYISYICDGSRSTPVVTNYTSSDCMYWITVSTSVTCGQPFNLNNNAGDGTSSSSSLSGGAIAGIVIGSVFGAVLLCVLLFCVCCRGSGLKKSKFNKMNGQTDAGHDLEMSNVAAEDSSHIDD